MGPAIRPAPSLPLFMPKTTKKKTNASGSSAAEFVMSGFDWAAPMSDHDTHRDSRWVGPNVPGFCLGLDALGVPEGVTEVAGDSGSGKTTLCVQTAIAAARDYAEEGCLVAYFSGEARPPSGIQRVLGGSAVPIVHVPIYTVEGSQNKLINLCNRFAEWKEANGKPDALLLVIYDSIGQTPSISDVSKAEENAGADDNKAFKVGAHAKAVKSLLQTIKYQRKFHRLVFLAINRTYSTISRTGVSTEVSVGGKQIPHLSSTRLRLRKLRDVKHTDGTTIGQNVRVRIVKSDFRMVGQFDLKMLRNNGYVLSDDDLELGVELGFVEKYFQGFKTTDRIVSGQVKWRSNADMASQSLHSDPAYIELATALTLEVQSRIMSDRGLA